MTTNFEPCSFMEHEDGQKSLCFSDFDPFIELLESKGGQGGGYSWESLVQAVLEMRSLNLPNLDFDPEADMFCAVSKRTESLAVIAAIIRELISKPDLMSQAIDKAIAGEYFE